jgi:putative alpha-1,2-mannosidase
MQESRWTRHQISRRQFLAGALAAGAGAMTPQTALGGVAKASSQTVRGALLGYVDPFVGVDGGGQTVPGAGLPFGFARVSPDTTDPGAEYTTTGYDSEGEILGFS